MLRLFVKNYEKTENVTVREKYGVLSGIFGIFWNIILAASKFVVGAITGSVAITADAFNNLTDCLTSIMTIFGFKMATKPADSRHPFGHARVEYLIGLVVAGVIFIAGYEVMRSSIEKIVSPEPVYFTPWAVGILVFAMAIKLWMWIFNNKLGRAIKSNTLLAVGIDSRNDVAITAVTLISLITTLFTDFVIDGYIGALIALIFIKSGFDVARDSLERIIGAPTDPELARSIKGLIKANKDVLGVHDLVVHSYGPGQNYASIHIEVCIKMSLEDAHKLSENVSLAVKNKLGVALTVHLDPIDTNDHRLQTITQKVRDAIEAAHPKLNAHEFRIKNSNPKPTLVFDLEIPHAQKNKNAKKANAALRDDVVKMLKQLDDGFEYDVNLEFGYTDNLEHFN